MDSSTLRPGLLVSLKTSMRGNVRYDKQDKRNVRTADGADVKEWETTRTVFDPVEHELATKVRQKARNLVASCCIPTSSFGLLCLKENVAALQEAKAEARRLVREFNRTAQLSKVRVYVVTAEMADNDEDAMRGVASEVADIIAEMQKGIKELKPEAIRTAAAQALKVGQMLLPAQQARIKETVDVARATARAYVKAGEMAAREVDKLAIEALGSKRTHFLDLSDMEEMAPVKPVGRAVGYAPDEEEAAPAPIKPRKAKARTADIDFENPDEIIDAFRTGKVKRDDQRGLELPKLKVSNKPKPKRRARVPEKV